MARDDEKSARPIYKNPFVIAAVAGMIFLPLVRVFAMWRRSAPPPMIENVSWQLPASDGTATINSSSLNGRVTAAIVVNSPCDAMCSQNQKSLTRLLEHTPPQHDLAAVVFTVGDGDDAKFLPDRVTSVRASAQQIDTILPGVYLDKIRERLSAKSHVLIFDQHHNLRGIFPTTDVGLASTEAAIAFLIEKQGSV